MKINGKEVNGLYVAYDGCHKLYVLEDEQDLKEARKLDYEVWALNSIPDLFETSCELRFINNWKGTQQYVKQFEKAVFEGFER